MTDASLVGNGGQPQHAGQHHGGRHHGNNQGPNSNSSPNSNPAPETGSGSGTYPDVPIDPAIAPNRDSSTSVAPSLPDLPPLPPDLPESFPKKRRGRPPGRPNANVRETDYSDNPHVQAWNAAKVSERPIPAIAIRIRDALTEQSLVHETQRALWRLPSRETIMFVQGWITAKHIASQRPSYINGLLIHSRGQDAAVACQQCQQKRERNALGPFLTCRILPGSFHNSCSNCKWFDNTAACSLYTGPKPNRKRKRKSEILAIREQERLEREQRERGQREREERERLQQQQPPAVAPEAEMGTGTGDADGEADESQPADTPGSGDGGGNGADAPADAEYVYAGRDSGGAGQSASGSAGQGAEDELDAARLAELLPEIQRPDS
ncbi:hypothetical protein VTJ04DRAFT_8858 [Mycothermus thermophilus]|uniref:uncharacterized protein n=1 Tax=Humicola insolens TaxID=85995 RepID=UPI003744214F